MRRNAPFVAACLLVLGLITAATMRTKTLSDERGIARASGWEVLEDGVTSVRDYTTGDGMKCLLVRYQLTVSVSCQ